MHTGVLASHPQSRDVHIISFTLLYHGHELLVDADLELNHGRRYGLLGPNGGCPCEQDGWIPTQCNGRCCMSDMPGHVPGRKLVTRHGVGARWGAQAGCCHGWAASSSSSMRGLINREQGVSKQRHAAQLVAASQEGGLQASCMKGSKAAFAAQGAWDT
jgi:ATP-binding cassette subfamily F protein 2